MSIKGSRSESIQGSTVSGARTGLIEWINNGTISLESHRNVGNLNLSSSQFGKALAADNDRTAARLVSTVPNDRAVATL